MGVERGRATQAVPTRSDDRRGHRRPTPSSRAATGERPAAGPDQAAKAPDSGEQARSGATPSPSGRVRRPMRPRLPRVQGRPAPGLARLRNPARRRRGTIRAAPGADAPVGVRLRGTRERARGLGGILLVLGALAWALVGGGAVPVGSLVAVGLGLAVIDAAAWRRTGNLDLAASEGEPLPAVPWGLLVGPAGGFGVAAALVAGAPVVAWAAGAAVVAALPGMFARLPATGVTYRVSGHARRIRMFVRSHGAADGESVPGYASPVGSFGARLVVFAPDGAWGDVMLRPDEVEAVARLARVELTDEHDPAIARRLNIGLPLWTLMNRSW